jgi:hypothetical protein
MTTGQEYTIERWGERAMERSEQIVPSVYKKPGGLFLEVPFTETAVIREFDFVFHYFDY